MLDQAPYPTKAVTTCKLGDTRSKEMSHKSGLKMKAKPGNLDFPLMTNESDSDHKTQVGQHSITMHVQQKRSQTADLAIFDCIACLMKAITECKTGSIRSYDMSHESNNQGQKWGFPTLQREAMRKCKTGRIGCHEIPHDGNKKCMPDHDQCN